MADREMPRSRHAEALGALVEDRYVRMVRFAGRRLHTRGVPQSWADPEDIVQNALKSVLAVTEPIDNVRAYVYTCIHHEVVHAAERHAKGSGYASLDADVRPEDEPAVHPVADAELRHAVDEALKGLPLQQRRVMLLTRELGMTQAEAARAMGSAPSTVGVQAHRAMRALRVTLAGLGTALTAWITWITTFGGRHLIPAAGIESPAGAVTLGLTGTVGILIIVSGVLVTWATGDRALRWAQMVRALLNAGEPGRAGRDEGSPSPTSAGTVPPEPTIGFPSYRGAADPPQ
ncbi:RNA polymerase sigma factor [Streptomyces sp. NPDC048514]|uniref:RNA polymerase sigma factor n=1 Tax=Streptomyces sp. NPDC048514 TaxID=3365564 RepID=UPI003722CF32